MQNGFTLIELLVSVSVIAFLMSGVFITAFHVISGSERTEAKLAIDGEAYFALKKIGWALQGASSIDTPSEDASGYTLRVSNNGAVFEFALLSGEITLSRDDGLPVPLTGAAAEFNDLVFEHIASPGNGPEGVRVTFTGKNMLQNPRGFEMVKYLK